MKWIDDGWSARTGSSTCSSPTSCRRPVRHHRIDLRAHGPGAHPAAERLMREHLSGKPGDGGGMVATAGPTPDWTPPSCANRCAPTRSALQRAHRDVALANNRFRSISGQSHRYGPTCGDGHSHHGPAAQHRAADLGGEARIGHRAVVHRCGGGARTVQVPRHLGAGSELLMTTETVTTTTEPGHQDSSMPARRPGGLR